MAKRVALLPKGPPPHFAPPSTAVLKKQCQKIQLQKPAGPVDDGVRSHLADLVILLFGVIQFGIVFNNYITVTDAVRAGAVKAPSAGICKTPMRRSFKASAMPRPT